MKLFLLSLSLSLSTLSFAQKAQIDQKEVERIETKLASDEMRGRMSGTPDIDRAADFISGEFKRIGLQPLPGNSSYLQSFFMVRSKPGTLKFESNGAEIDPKNIVVLTSKSELKITETSHYEVMNIKAGENLIQKAQAMTRMQKNLLVVVENSEDLSKNFPRLNGLRRGQFKSDYSTVFILVNTLPSTFTLKLEQSVEEVKYTNVVGMIPGRSRKNEQVIFSGHYDHLGVSKKPDGADSIFNGANDDAAGTTAVIMLADHFNKLKNNERTLIFAAFTAEEVGGFGSQYFSRQLNADDIKAMFNIEMIGTDSKWGNNSAYITGYEKTDMGAILQKNLAGTSFTFYPDPYTEQNLFYRSDNATLARLGVPAHTISTSKMDSEPNYHKLSDHVETLDLANMTEIIKAIALSSSSIISGKDTPGRVNTEGLK